MKPDREETEPYVEPTPDEWRRLYQAALRFKKLAPWEWMDEDDLFAVQNPETGEIGFVSIMGALGEHLAAAVYLGAEGLHRFWHMHTSGMDEDGTDLLATPQLQASFEDRRVLTDADRKTIKALGLKFRGKQAWPMFRSFRPGYFPWLVQVHEARFLTYALEQILDVTPRFRDDPDLFFPDDDAYLLRVARSEGDGLVWEDRAIEEPDWEPEPIQVEMDVDLLEKAQELAYNTAPLEIDFFLMPVLIGAPGDRPRCAYNLMMVDSQVGFIYATDVVEAEPSLTDMYGTLPLRIVKHFVGMGFLPVEIRARSEPLLSLLELLSTDLGFKVIESPVLPALDQAKELMMRFL